MRHDQGYKLLFSETSMVADLIRGFVPGEWVERLDLASLEHVGGSYVSEDLRERHTDVVWRVRFADDSWLYVYLLLEFQSKVDPYMALRIMVYQGLLYQDIIKKKLVPPGAKFLPPVVPLVLYNGREPWTAAVDVAQLVLPVVGLEHFTTRCRYMLVDEIRCRADALLEQRNLVAALFKLEQSPTEQDFATVGGLLYEWLKAPAQESLLRALDAWYREAAHSAGFSLAENAGLSGSKEFQMLAERMKEWKENWLAEGIALGEAKGKAEGKAEGEAEGKAKGKAEGKANMLLHLLRLRFGPPPREVVERVEGERDTDQLDRWAERLFAAESIEDIFR